MKQSNYISQCSPTTKLILCTVLHYIAPSQQQSLIRPQQIENDDDGTMRDPTIKSKYNSEFQMHSNIIDNRQWKSAQQILRESNMKGNIPILIPKEEFESKLQNNVEKYRYLYDIEKDSEINTWIMLPSSKLFQMGQLIQSINFCLLVFYLPMQITFELPQLNELFLILILLNVIFQIKSSFAIDGELITSQSSIFKNYIRESLLRDVIKIISIGMFTQNVINDWILFPIIIFTHIQEFSTIFKKYQIQFNLFSPQFQIFKLSLQFIAIVHVLVCVWHSQDIQILQTGQHSYLQALYITIGILTMNNNYTPQNDEELILFCLTALVSIFLLCYILIRLSQIIDKDTQLIETNNFIHDNGVNTNYELTEQILSSNQRIPIKLMKQIRLYERMHILGEYFNKYSPFTIRKLVELCEVVKCEPNQVILDESTKDDCSVYFILEGIFKVCNTNGTRLGTLSRKKESVQTFGEISFFTGQNRTASIVSECNGRLLKLSRECFQKEMNAIDKQIFFSTRDEIVFQQKLPKTCLCCQSNSHYILKCPLLTYQPDIKDQNCNDLQERKPMKRSLYKDQRAWEFVTVSGMIQDDLKEIYEENKQINLRGPIEGQQYYQQSKKCESECEMNQLEVIDKEEKRKITPSCNTIQNSYVTFLNLSESEKTIKPKNQWMDQFEKLFHYDQYFPQQNYDVAINKLNSQRNQFNVKDSTQAVKDSIMIFK